MYQLERSGMPPKATWFVPTTGIIRQLSALEVPALDGHVCETIFGVKRRRAITLMQQFGGTDPALPFCWTGISSSRISNS